MPRGKRAPAEERPALPIRVLCVDDSAEVCDAILRLVRGQPDMEGVGSVATADAMLSEISGRRPDVVLVDLTMPGRDPLDAVQEAAAKFDQVRCIVLSGHSNPRHVDMAADAGAWGYLCKGGPAPEILAAIRGVAAGSAWFRSAS